MKAVTVQDVMSWDPCKKYTVEKVTKLFAGRETMTALDMLKLDIPASDKLWAVLREDLIPAPILHEFACRCAEYALSKIDNPDPRSIAAIEAKRSWLRGEITDGELSAARSAAWYAARSAAWYAARSAAWYAAWSAARSAANAAAMSAAGEQQIKILMELLESEG